MMIIIVEGTIPVPLQCLFFEGNIEERSKGGGKTPQSVHIPEHI